MRKLKKNIRHFEKLEKRNISHEKIGFRPIATSTSPGMYKYFTQISMKVKHKNKKFGGRVVSIGNLCGSQIVNFVGSI